MYYEGVARPHSSPPKKQILGLNFGGYGLAPFQRYCKFSVK